MRNVSVELFVVKSSGDVTFFTCLVRRVSHLPNVTLDELKELDYTRKSGKGAKHNFLLCFFC